MVERHADQGYRKLWKTLKEMTWKERWEHLAYYYGVAALFALAVLIAGGAVLYDTLREKPEVLFNGMTVNVELSKKAETALTDELFEFLGGENPEKQEVTMTDTWLQQYDYNIITSLTARVYTGQVDYLIVDQSGLNYLAPWDVFTDLTLLMTEEQLAGLEERFSYGERTDGTRFPMVINLKGTAFAKECEYEGDNLYIGFPGNTDRLDALATFLNYLLEGF